MEEKTGIYLIVGLAAVGIAAYFLMKKPVPPPPPGEGETVIVDWYLFIP